MKHLSRLFPGSYRSAGFIEKYQRLVKETVLPYQYDVMCDIADGAEKSHAIKNFENAAKLLKGENPGEAFYGMIFQDSDVAKWIEATAYSLMRYPDSSLENVLDDLINTISEAQDSDGYLNTYFTLSDKDKRWTNLLEAHELYCAGHMIEAACAYFEATGKTKFLDVMTKNVEHIYKRFVTDGYEGCPGHPEIELALMKMYRITQNRHCLELVERFVNDRGKDPGFYAKEREKRNWTVWDTDPWDNVYRQSDRPVREQTDAEGHAVRAMYLYTGMADLASETDDKTLFDSCCCLWKSVTQKRMYVTGGIGSTVIGEAFSVDYDLPPDTAYCETCASIGLMLFASRMLENDLDSEYADVMERAFYNTVLAGMQLDGKKFFYVNPLECVPGISGESPTHRHDLPSRPSWYTCACCPPNVARIISSIGRYAYGESADTAFVNLYAAGEVKFKNGIELVCKTDYPYGFDVDFKILRGGRLALRIPNWSKKFVLQVNSDTVNPEIKKGYVYLNTCDSDEIRLSLDSTPRFIYPSTKIPALTGKVALYRGPLVYCFEGVDNGGDVLSLKIKTDIVPKIILDIFAPKIAVQAIRKTDTGELYSFKSHKTEPCEAIAVPYYTWANRGVNQMRVWMDAE